MRIFAFIALILFVQLGFAAVARPSRKAAPKAQPKALATDPYNLLNTKAATPRAPVRQQQRPKPAARPSAKATKQRPQRPAQATKQRPQQPWPSQQEANHSSSR
ncbi:hypothetical protein GQ42DRAFT_54319 [Ramicandelaber brevisporus]|nr:hypothetical protein GQ42DRAFT_54319 [Ramicandelaber brevisporus]